MIVMGVVEDDPVQAEHVRVWLDHWGYDVRNFSNADEFRRRLGAESVDAVLLDWTLPDESGLDLLRWLRQGAHANLPVIMLTGRHAEPDVVAALATGADDFVAKPPRTEELHARIKAVLRRAGVGASTDALGDIAPYAIDATRRRVTIEDAAVELTGREFDLAAFLFRRIGRVVSRDMLLKQVWNVSGRVTTRTIDTHISRLRKKLGLGGENGFRLAGIYQHGYRLERC